MKTLIRLIVATASLVATFTASAGDGSGAITKLTAYGTVVLFSVTDHSAKSACSQDGSFVINASTQDGKVIYAALLTAVASGRSISVFSANTCPSWWANAETPNSVTINP